MAVDPVLCGDVEVVLDERVGHPLAVRVLLTPVGMTTSKT